MKKTTRKIYENRIRELKFQKDMLQAEIDKMHNDYAKDKSKYFPDKMGELMAELDDIKDDLSDLEWSLENNVE